MNERIEISSNDLQLMNSNSPIDWRSSAIFCNFQTHLIQLNLQVMIQQSTSIQSIFLKAFWFFWFQCIRNRKLAKWWTSQERWRFDWTDSIYFNIFKQFSKALNPTNFNGESIVTLASFMYPVNVLDPIDDTDDGILISLRDEQFSKEPYWIFFTIFLSAVHPLKVEDGISFNLDNISILLNDVRIFENSFFKINNRWRNRNILQWNALTKRLRSNRLYWTWNC